MGTGEIGKMEIEVISQDYMSEGQRLADWLEPERAKPWRPPSSFSRAGLGSVGLAAGTEPVRSRPGSSQQEEK